jgi:hypothetical protein
MSEKINRNKPFCPSSPSRTNTPNRCHFYFSDGRRCRMLLHHSHPTLCLFHSREELQLLEADRLGMEISTSLTGNFLTATDINHVLGKLFTALAQRRIPPRHAATLAYIAQLMLLSVKASHAEITQKTQERWKSLMHNATELSPPPFPVTPTQSVRPTTPVPAQPAAPKPKPSVSPAPSASPAAEKSAAPPARSTTLAASSPDLLQSSAPPSECVATSPSALPGSSAATVSAEPSTSCRGKLQRVPPSASPLSPAPAVVSQSLH